MARDLDHGQAQGQVRYEVVVHDVHVCSQSAPATAATSSARWAKSALRMLGAIRTVTAGAYRSADRRWLLLGAPALHPLGKPGGPVT